MQGSAYIYIYICIFILWKYRTSPNQPAMLDFRVIGICRSKLKQNHAKIVIKCSIFFGVAKRAYWGSPSNEKAPSVGIMASGFPKPSPGDLNKETFIMCHGHIYRWLYILVKWSFPSYLMLLLLWLLTILNRWLYVDVYVGWSFHHHEWDSLYYYIPCNWPSNLSPNNIKHHLEIVAYNRELIVDLQRSFRECLY